jgi:6-pyruvoyl-tetrahydropterin synthase
MSSNLRLRCGHDYVLDVTVAGSPDPLTGFSVDLAALDRF